MQTANILLALNGDNNNVVYKRNVTPPEMAVLRVFHGADSIKRLEIHAKSQDKRSHSQEWNRLNALYANAQDQRGRSIFLKIFPARHDMTLPDKFTDVGFSKMILGETPDDLNPMRKPGFNEIPIIQGYIHIEPEEMAEEVPVPVPAGVDGIEDDFEDLEFKMPVPTAKKSK